MRRWKMLMVAAGLVTTQKVRRSKFPAVRRGKRLSLRWVRTLLMGVADA